MSTIVAIKERPILFSGPMVSAILGDLKTKTRRVVKPQPPDDLTELGVEYINHATKGRVAQATYRAFPDGGSARWAFCECPYVVGGRLRVRETFGVSWGDGALVDPTINYRADGAQVPILPGTEMFDQWREWYLRPRKRAWNPEHWRPGRFMPRFLSRILLEVTSVGIERLQDISEEEAKAEGMEPGCLTCGENCLSHGGCGYCQPTWRESFIYLWDKLNADRGYSWESNPWVWDVGFRRLESAK